MVFMRLKKIHDLISLRETFPLLEIIIASDCSNDGTDQICKKYADQKAIKICRSTRRNGKEAAQYTALNIAQGDIIVFSDVSVFIHKTSLCNMLAYFSNPDIGAVSSRDRLINNHGSYDMEGIYIKYEMWVRKVESKLAGCVGMSGSFFAVRKKYCHPWRLNTCSDFNLAMNVARAGSRSISAEDSFGYYSNLKDTKDECKRRVRTVLKGMEGLYNNADVLMLSSNPLFSFEVFSHKLMRWLSPWFFIVLFLYLMFMWDKNILNSSILIGQIVILAIYMLSIVFTFLIKLRFFKVIIFFVSSNISVFKAGFKFLKGDKVRVWEPSRR